MSDITRFLQRLQVHAQQHHCRFAVRLEGGATWRKAKIDAWLAQNSSTGAVFQLGGEPCSDVDWVAYNKGQQLLGRECQRLICDISAGLDANSFSAALGTLAGGGVLIVSGELNQIDNPATQWLQRCLQQLALIRADHIPALPDVTEVQGSIDFSQQNEAIANIERVVSGHRKRPLVLTADRGRGKSSALGIAAARLLPTRKLDIIVTAPSQASVTPLFHHAQQLLPDAVVKKGEIRVGQSRLHFVAPDELMRHEPQCDLLLVDEAAALPIPFLTHFVEHYHRAVFSTTIHGYEGCGRGFTLKFVDWLRRERPQFRAQHIEQPIRWSQGDPLEAWHRRAFLLDYEFPSLSSDFSVGSVNFAKIEKVALLKQPELLTNIFSLLVNAHYQTSPNDLLHLLSDEAMTVYVARFRQQIVGCVLAVREGELETDLIEQIQLGKRRPKGHLTPVTLANQLGLTAAATHSCWRVMRIAVHPQCQQLGLGSLLVEQFIASHPADYYATSFGATHNLVNFWQRNQFCAVKLGSARDQASGCYSLLMVRAAQSTWLPQARQQFFTHFDYELKDTLRALEPELVQVLMAKRSIEVRPLAWPLLRCYTSGGANYESVAVWVELLLRMLSESQWERVSGLMIGKVVQQHTWQECAKRHQLNGRKAIEQALRSELANLLSNLQCKPE